MDQGLQYGSGSLAVLFGLLAIATMVIFVVYAAEWHNNKEQDTYTEREQGNHYVQVTYAYQAFVIIALSLFAGMHGYVIMREFY